MHAHSCVCYVHDQCLFSQSSMLVLSVLLLQCVTSISLPPPVLVSGSEGVPVEVHEALCVAMEKLQHRFTSLMQEKADLKERVEELEHRCIQLSGETDTIGDNHTPLYSCLERLILSVRHTLSLL